MGLLKWLFGRRKLDKRAYVEAMLEMASEAERTHRGMVATYNSDIAIGMLSAPDKSPVMPTGRGIYKARLFGAMCMATAYARSSPTERDALEMFNVATGVAIETLRGSSDAQLSHEEAKSFALPLAVSLYKAIKAALDAGSFLPGKARPVHIVIAEFLHDALTESIGQERYRQQIKERFDVLVQMNVAMALNHASRW